MSDALERPYAIRRDGVAPVHFGAENPGAAPAPGLGSNAPASAARRRALVALAVLALTGCGRKGPLYLSDDPEGACADCEPAANGTPTKQKK